MIWTAAFASLSMMASQSSVDQRYGACLGTPDPNRCVAEVAMAGNQNRSIDLLDRIAAGAVEAAAEAAPRSDRDVVSLAARISRGERPALSPTQAQAVLDLFGEVEFYDSGLPGDARADWLWPIALSAPISLLERRQSLIATASRSGRDEDVRRLISEAPMERRWTADQRASFASQLARSGHADAADAWLASGGDRARGYHVPGIRREISRARLLAGYEAGAATALANGITADDEVSLWLEDEVAALAAAGASGEAKRAAEALLAKGRDPQREIEARTDDLAAASMLLVVAGDQEAALEAAREGARLTPLAVTERLQHRQDAGALSPAIAAEMANGFGTEPVQQLYRLGATEEALSNGYLAGRDRYRLELRAGRRPDPSWLTGHQIDFQLKLLVPELLERRAVADARALLDHLLADPAVLDAAGTEELMMLAAIAGDDDRLDDLFARAVRRLDDAELGSSRNWVAIQLVIGRRAADAVLASQPV
ncbi:hypothetical protein [Brevundimonas sp. GCM10030266]|uniref:hypothetical protein n=1 Tax=Brevundimonas sp. GCM10030266 TaxID=3273386 RepID=UPI0036166EE3